MVTSAQTRKKTAKPLHSLIHKKIDQAANSYKENLISTTLQLVQEKTVNFDKIIYTEEGPDHMLIPGMEYKLIDHLRPLLEEAHIDFQTYDESLKRPILIASVGQGIPKHREILLVSHLDSFPSGKYTWKKIKDPFRPEEIAGKLYGNGVCDNKAAVAASLHTLLILKELEEKILGKVHVAFISDEIIHHGINFANTIEASEYNPDDILLLYGGNGLKQATIASLGTATYSVSVTHPLEPAPQALQTFLEKVRSYTFKPQTKSKFFPRPTEPLITSITAINNGITKNKGTTELQMNLFPDQTKKEIIAQLNGLLSTSELKPFDWTITVHKYIPAYYFKKQPLVFKTLQKITSIEPCAKESSSLANILVEKGFEPICYSLHSQSPNDESIKISELVTFTKTIAKVAFEMASSEK